MVEYTSDDNENGKKVTRFSMSLPTFLLVVLLITQGVFFTLTYSAWDAVVSFMRGAVAIRAAQSQQATVEHRILSDAFDEITYMLSIPEKERPRLRAPRSLIKKLDEAERQQAVEELTQPQRRKSQ